MKFHHKIIYLVIFLTSLPLFAREDIIPGSRYTSGRGAALGDAFLPLADDVPSGLFYNPAGLGKVRHLEVEPLNFSGYFNSGFLSTLSGSSVGATSLSSIAPTLQSNVGQNVGVGGAFIPSVGFPGFHFGILVQTQLGAKANSGGTITYRSLYQFIPAMGTAIRIANGIIRIGYSLQMVNQASGNPTVSASSALGYDKGLSQGTALSHNFGLALTAPMQFLPSLNFVARNVFGANFMPFTVLNFANSPSGVPATEPMTVDGSLSIQPRLGRGVSLNLVLEGRDLLNTTNLPWLTRVALGAELVIQNRVFLRGGWGSGYPSAGLGVRSKTSEISFSWFSEELGSQYALQRDQHFMIHYQIRAF